VLRGPPSLCHIYYKLRGWSNVTGIVGAGILSREGWGRWWWRDGGRRPLSPGSFLRCGWMAFPCGGGRAHALHSRLGVRECIPPHAEAPEGTPHGGAVLHFGPGTRDAVQTFPADHSVMIGSSAGGLPEPKRVQRAAFGTADGHFLLPVLAAPQAVLSNRQPRQPGELSRCWSLHGRLLTSFGPPFQG
jgi:hypothetical protein